MSNILQISPPARMNNAVFAALVKRQEAVNQAEAIASLLLQRFEAAVDGHEGPDEAQVVAALQVVVDRLQACNDLTDAVALERSTAAHQAASEQGA